MNGAYLFLVFIRLISLSECVVFLNTKLGPIKGFQMTSRDGRRFNAFLGIPFAKPPVGGLRFKDPEPITEPWSYTLDATTYSPRCPQLYGPSGYSGDEDCLHINVYTPALPDRGNTRFPVWVWIFPGKRMFGDQHPNHYGPQYIMDRDVIFVAPGYRLNTLGFLSTGDDACPGNFGLKDQTLALRWIQDNIEEFGGDPTNVTLSGESSSAADVNFHLFSPLSKGLFHRVIAQSGSALNHRTLISTAEARKRAWQLGRILGCRSKYLRTSEDLIGCLRLIPAEILARSVYLMMHDYVLPYAVFGPVLEKEEPSVAFLTTPTYGNFNKIQNTIPLLIGVNGDEGAPKMLSVYARNNVFHHFFVNYGRLFPHYYGYDHLTNATEITQKVISHYVGNRPFNESFRAMSDMTGFAAITLGVLETAKQYKGPCYLYHYDHIHHVNYFRGFEILLDSYLNVQVGMENRFPLSSTSLYIVIENTAKICLAGAIHGEELLNFFYLPLFFPAITKGIDREVSDRMLDLWFNFVKYGNPNGSNTKQIWHPVSSSNLQYLYINTTHAVMKKQHSEEEYKFWREIGKPTIMRIKCKLKLRL